MPVLIMDRQVEKTFKKDFEKEVMQYTVTLYYAKGLGLVKFSSSGEPFYFSEVVKIEHKKRIR